MTYMILEGTRTGAVLGYLDGNPIIDASHPNAEQCVRLWKELQKNILPTVEVESTEKNSDRTNTIFSYFIRKRKKSQGDLRK